MKRIIITKSLLCIMLASIITSQAHASWTSWFTNYFNQPSRTALIATTAFAGLSCIAALTCTWGWWNARNTNKQHSARISNLESESKGLKGRSDTLALCLNENTTALNDAWTANKSANLQIEQLSTALSTARQANESAKVEYARVVKERDELSRSNKSMREHNVKTRQEEIPSLTSRIAKLEEEIATLRETDSGKTVANYREQIKALEMQNETLKERNAQLSRRLTPPVSPHNDFAA